MVVSWKEDSGRQLHLITSENERGYETNYPSPPNFTIFDDPDVPFGPQGPPLPGLAGLPCLPPGWPPAPSPAVIEQECEPEIHRVSGYLRDLHHPSLNLFQLQ